MTYSLKNSWPISVAVLATAFLISFAIVVFASSKDDIVFPVQALGGCKNETDCRTYCDQPVNSRACLAFIKKHNLISQEEIARWEKFIDVASGEGPGGCTNEADCIKYCEDASHMVECLAFVEKHNFVSPKVLAEMRQIATALQAGEKLPGNCRNKAECLAYCENAAHINECVEFAEKAGFISKEEADEARKFAPFIGRGETPGGCKRKAECEAYCANMAHIDECILFAEKAGMFSKEELEEAKKVAPFLKRGETPGSCKSKAECEAYCAIDSNFEECITFAERAGFVSKEDAETARKFGGKGPGDCRSREACEAFCSKPENQKACLDFAKEHDLISQDELKYIDQLGDFHLCFENLDQEARSCFEEKLGKNALEQMLAGQLPFRPDMKGRAEAAKSCVKKTDSRLEAMPAEMRSCLEQRTGSDIITKIKTGDLSCRDISSVKEHINACVTEFKAKVEREASACAEKPCKELLSCMQGLQAKYSGIEGRGEQDKLSPGVQTKLDACIGKLQSEYGVPGSEERTRREEEFRRQQEFEERKNKATTVGNIHGCIVELSSVTIPETRTCLANGLAPYGGIEKACTNEQGTANSVYARCTRQWLIGLWKKAIAINRQRMVTCWGWDTIAKIERGEDATGGAHPDGCPGKSSAPATPSQQPSSQYFDYKQYCPEFESAPSCSYAGAPGSQSYKLCKQCFPNK